MLKINNHFLSSQFGNLFDLTNLSSLTDPRGYAMTKIYINSFSPDNTTYTQPQTEYRFHNFCLRRVR